MNIISCCHTPSPSTGAGTALRAVACVMAFVGTEEGRRMSSPLTEQGTITLLGFTQSGVRGGVRVQGRLVAEAAHTPGSAQASRAGGACTES